MPKQQKNTLKIKFISFNLNHRFSSTLASLTSTFTFNSSKSKKTSLSTNPYQLENIFIQSKASSLDLLEIKNPINVKLEMNTKLENETEDLEEIDNLNIPIPHVNKIQTNTNSMKSNPFCSLLESSSSNRILHQRLVSIPTDLSTILEDKLREEEENDSCFVEMKIINQFSTYTYHSIDEPSKRRKGLYRPGLDLIQLRGTPSKPYSHLTGYLKPKRQFNSSPYIFKSPSRSYS